MDKKWWDAEARLCESHGLHIQAQLARDIGNEVKRERTREERAREYLAQIEHNIRVNFARRRTTRLVMTAKPKGK